jgi:hypothetical protein
MPLLRYPSEDGPGATKWKYSAADDDIGMGSRCNQSILQLPDTDGSVRDQLEGPVMARELVGTHLFEELPQMIQKLHDGKPHGLAVVRGAKSVHTCKWPAAPLK